MKKLVLNCLQVFYAVSVESIFMSEEGGQSASQISYLAKFQEPHTSLNRHEYCLQPQILKNSTKSVYHIDDRTQLRVSSAGIGYQQKANGGAKSTYTRYSGISGREFSAKDFKQGSKGLKKLKNSLLELSLSVEKGNLSLNKGVIPRLPKVSSSNLISSSLQEVQVPSQVQMYQAKSETKRNAHQSKIQTLGYVGRQDVSADSNSFQASIDDLGNKQDTVSTSSFQKKSLKFIQKNLQSLVADLEVKDYLGSNSHSRLGVPEYLGDTNQTFDCFINASEMNMQHRFAKKYSKCPSEKTLKKFRFASGHNNRVDCLPILGTGFATNSSSRESTGPFSGSIESLKHPQSLHQINQQVAGRSNIVGDHRKGSGGGTHDGFAIVLQQTDMGDDFGEVAEMSKYLLGSKQQLLKEEECEEDEEYKMK